MTDFAHPVTGEVLSTKEEFLAALVEEEERLSPIYHTVWALRDAMTERFEAPELPSRVNRTEKQERLARCPRCGGHNDMERVRQIILRGWDDHMSNFEMMDEGDEQWLLKWAGHPSAESEKTPS